MNSFSFDFGNLFCRQNPSASPKISVFLSLCPPCFLVKVANYICNKTLRCDFTPFAPSCLTCRRLHPLKSRYVALPCDHCFDTWTIWTISIIILDSLFFFFLTLMQTSVSFVSEQGNSDVCTSRVHERLFLMSYPRKVSLLSHSHFPDWSIEMEFPNFVSVLKWIMPISPLSLPPPSSTSWKHGPCLFLTLIHFMPVCTAVCTETKFTTFTSLYLRQRLVWYTW